MKKSLSLLLTAIITVSILSSCANKDTNVPEGFKEISDGAIGYDLYVPEDWISDISTGITSAYFSNTDPSNISMTSFELNNDVQSIEDYWKFYLPSLRALFPDLQFDNLPEDADPDQVTVGIPEQLKIDGVPALAYNYTGSMNGTAYKFYQVITFKNATVYIFTYTAETTNYDAHIKDVVDILANIKFD